LRKRDRLAVVLISHNLGVVAACADHVTVWYSGRIVESGLAAQILRHPRHPYTQSLLSALPNRAGQERLVPIRGAAPSPRDRPAGCAFHPRCAFAVDECSRSDPARLEV